MKKIGLFILVTFFTKVCLAQLGCTGCFDPGTFTLNTPTGGSIGASSVTLSWSASSSATRYQVKYKLSTSSTFLNGCSTVASTRTCTVTGLTAGATYDFKVESSYDCNGTDPETGAPCSQTPTRMSAPVTITTDSPSTPSGLANSLITQTSFTASWDDVAGETGYAVEVYNGITLIYSTTTSVNDTDKSISDPDITAGNTYTWRVKANGAGTSSSVFSSPKSITMVPSAPAGLSASAHSTTSFTASWNDVTGETAFELDVSLNSTFTNLVPGFNDLQITGTPAPTSKDVTGLSPGTTYHFRVRAKNCNSCVEGVNTSGNSSTFTTITVPAVPVLTAADGITQNSFTTHWNATPGASTYRLDVSLDNFASLLDGYNNLSVNETSKTVTGLVAGNTYKYRVRAVNSSGTSVSSAISEATLVPPDPEIAATTEITQTAFTANWVASSGATSYSLDVSTDNFATFVNGLSNVPVVGTSKSFTGLTSGVAYQYRVRAVNGSGTSANSTTGSARLIPGNPVAESALDATTTAFTARWQTSVGANNYSLDVSEDNFATFVSGYNGKNETGTSHAITTTLAPGKTYAYRVRALNATGASSHSNIIEITLVPDKPSVVDVQEITQTSFTARWSAVTGADSYRLDLSTDNFATFANGFSNVPVIGTSKAFTGLTSGGAYQFRVRAVNGSGTSSNSTTGLVQLIPGDPAGLSAIGVTDASFTAVWEPVPGATGYLLDVSEDNFTTFVSGYNGKSETGTSHTVTTTLVPGKTYVYRLRAVNATGTSSYSNTAEVILVPDKPSGTEAQDITQTSFTARWNSVTGANSYRFDVSDDNFQTFMNGFSNLQVDDNFTVVTGLAPGKTYQCRVRASNGSGTSNHSNSLTVILIPSATETLPPTDITPLSFTAKWRASAGATAYKLDVSEDNFLTFIAGYENLTVNDLFKEITGLREGKIYYYRVRASTSSGSSGNSNIIQVTTVPPVPSLDDPHNISKNSFSISWPGVPGATGYRVDVASNLTFTNFVEGFQNKEVTTLVQDITGLSPGSVYHVRVRSLNSSGISQYSTTKSQVTIANAPVNVQVTDRGPDRIAISWESAVGAANYSVEVSLSESFANLLPGFPKNLENQTTFLISNLQPATVYYVRLRTVNNAGISEYTNTKLITTTRATGGDDFALIVNQPDFNAVFHPQDHIRLQVSGGQGEITTVFHHRPITSEEDFEDLLLTSEDGRYQVPVNESWMDDLGMEFFFTVTDQSQQEYVTQKKYIHRDVANGSIPLPAFGGKLKHYRIIAMPYDLEDPVIENVFEPVLGNYDKRKWRLLHYNGDRTADYSQGISKTKMLRGLGYWFNSKENITLSFGDAQIPDNNQQNPFVLNLRKGWNQIGNPYPFAINWQSILEINDQPQTVSTLIKYDHENLSLTEADQMLQKFEGAFVWADENIDITIPVTSRSNDDSGGRVSAGKNIDDRQGWFVPVTLLQGEMTVKSNGFGMREDARDGKDKFDMPTVPRFVYFLEWKRKVNDIELARDIVRLCDKYTWDFEIDYNVPGPVTIQWDSKSLDEGTLILLDVHERIIVNMLATDHYTFSGPPRTFRIFFDRKASWKIDERVNLGAAFPNPTESRVIIPYALPGANYANARARLIIRSATGICVADILADPQNDGLLQVEWNLKSSDGQRVPAGLYFFELTNTETMVHFCGRIIVR